MKRVGLGIILTIVMGACASTSADYQPQTTVASSEEIANGFRMAVLDVCVASAVGGASIADLATETGPIVRVEDPALTRLAQAKDGDAVWSSRDAKGAVLIRSNGRECQVSAYGPPARQTLEAVGQGLSDPHGFVLDPSVKGRGGALLQRFTRKVGDRTFYVTLSGADRGARPLTAVVTATPPA